MASQRLEEIQRVLIECQEELWKKESQSTGGNRAEWYESKYTVLSDVAMEDWTIRAALAVSVLVDKLRREEEMG